jgi:hypothetical protein
VQAINSADVPLVRLLRGTATLKLDEAPNPTRAAMDFSRAMIDPSLRAAAQYGFAVAQMRIADAKAGLTTGAWCRV